MTTDLDKINRVLGQMPYLPAARKANRSTRAESLADVPEILSDLADYLADIAYGYEALSASHNETLRDIEGLRRILATGGTE